MLGSLSNLAQVSATEDLSKLFQLNSACKHWEKLGESLESKPLLRSSRRKRSHFYFDLFTRASLIVCLIFSSVILFIIFSDSFDEPPPAREFLRDLIQSHDVTFDVLGSPGCTKHNWDHLNVVTYNCGDPPGTRTLTRMIGACDKTIYVTCPSECPYPSVCTAPLAAYSYEATIHHPRYEWPNQAGYCGAVSITIIAQSYGIWLSQHFIRMHAPRNEYSEYDKGWGSEVDHHNIEETLANLKLDIDAWPWRTTNSSTEYFKFLQKNLVKKFPLVWFLILHGDPNIESPGIHYNHVEPIFGFYSNHSLDEYHPENVIVHASDWDELHYYRSFESLPDKLDFSGNCKNAPDAAGHNEAYPCIDDDGPNFAYAIKGLIDPKNRMIRISLDVHTAFEPNVADGKQAIWFNDPTIQAEEPLTPGKAYSLFRFDADFNDMSMIPVDSDFENSPYTWREDFTATSDDFLYTDSKPIRSDLGVYYALVEQLHP